MRIPSRRTRLGAAILIAAMHFACVALAAGDDPERPWRVGYAEAEITPGPGQCMMAGYGTERYAKGVLSPLWAQAVAFRDGEGHTGVLVAVDLLGFDRVMVEAIRRGIGKAHGIPPEYVLLSASHTHWGPAISMQISFGIGAPNVWYLARLEETILAAVAEALEDASAAAIEYAWIDFREIGCNRRRPVEGTITWGPNPEGSFDGHTPILRIARDSDPREIVIVGHACHPTSSGRIEKYSPDYPGAMRDALVAKRPGARAVFVQGCGADAKIVHEDPETGALVFSADPRRAEAAGRRLADAVLARLEKGGMTPLGSALAAALATGTLRYGKRWPREDIEKQAFDGATRSWATWAARQYLALPVEREDFRYDVGVWRLGGRLTLFAMEGEVCSPWGPAVRAMARTDEAMVIGYANSTTVYIPDARIVREGGYEGLRSHQVYFQPGPFTEGIDGEIRAIVTRALDGLE